MANITTSAERPNTEAENHLLFILSDVCKGSKEPLLWGIYTHIVQGTPAEIIFREIRETAEENPAAMAGMIGETLLQTILIFKS